VSAIYATAMDRQTAALIGMRARRAADSERIVYSRRGTTMTTYVTLYRQRDVIVTSSYTRPPASASQGPLMRLLLLLLPS